MGSEDADAWELAGLPGGVPQAAYLSGPLAAQYRLIVDVLLAQQEHTLTGVAAADLPGLLRAELGAHARVLDDPGFNLDARMRRLKAWQVVDIWQDRALRDEDFLRNLDRYQLTPAAADLHRAVLRMGQDVADAAAATFAPSVLTAHLTVLRDTAAGDPGAAAEAWSVIRTTHRAMADAAAGWQARLAAAQSGAPDPGKLTQVQETLRRYVEMWGAGIDTHSDTITGLLSELRAVTGWRRVAVHHLGAAADEPAVEGLVASYARTLDTLRRWFDGPQCQARRLRRQMRDTISPLVRGQRTLAAVGGHVSRRAELLALAGQLEATGDDVRGWELWCAATGLFSARHLPGVAPEPAGNPAATSFWDAEPVPVEARLRRHGPKATTGSAARIPDRSEGRRAAKARAAELQSAAARTEAAVAARSGQRLSQWREVAGAELDLLLTMLTVLAGARSDATGTRHARTGDDRWVLRAEPAEPQAPAAVLHTPDGRLVHPDIRLHITAAGRPA
ncbi:DUF2397 domain-containing protein [Actinoplanes sp. N902-109]|uniref:DUF2397 domain-containing protein n=1 Tax=Actinoplanes sp. (strain N902-109) TaxID=649831 RepID=UPI0003295F3D|nr:DUF2397 domain-containing protein [Actinoplanes sp. N902-109]AGL17609.1 hypothetical protein L083_4099 [Actinoplanes sp. N902-109]